MNDQTSRHLSILIVDDDARIRRALGRCLELDGHTVQCVATGTDALARCHEHQWDLICLDAQLPDILGPDLARRMRDMQRSAYLVLVTGFASSFDDTALLTEGIDAVLPKPWRVEELDAVLERVRMHLVGRPSAHAA